MSKDQDFGSKPEAGAGTLLNGKHATSQPRSEVTAELESQPRRTRPPPPWGRPVLESVAHYAARQAAREQAKGSGGAGPVSMNTTTGTQAGQARQPENWGKRACLERLEKMGLGDSLLAQALREDLQNPNPYRNDSSIAITGTLIGDPPDPEFWNTKK